MRVKVARGAIQESAADTIIVNLFAGVTTPAGATGAVDQALDGAIQELIAQGDLRGKAGETAVLYPRGRHPAKRVIVVGLGSGEKFDLEGVRRAAAAGIRRARELVRQEAATIVHGAGIGGLDLAAAAQATIEGSLLALYQFNELNNKEDVPTDPESLTMVEFDETRIATIPPAWQRRAIVSGVTLARDLVNLPANYATPTHMAAAAEEIAAAYGMKLTVGDRDWAQERNMGAYLAVAQGAGEPPKFIILEHNG
jgi:leucyl aminopeptidase